MIVLGHYNIVRRMWKKSKGHYYVSVLCAVRRKLVHLICAVSTVWDVICLVSVV